MSTEITGQTDLLRAAAQGMAQGMANTYPGRNVTVGCSCGAAAQTVTEWSFDERGRLDEQTLWGLVRVMEHCIERDETHGMTELVVA